VFFRNNEDESVARNITVGDLKLQNEVLNEVLNDNMVSRIMKELNRNPAITQKELAQELGATLSTVQRKMKMMIEAGVLTRVGAKKKGYWKLNS